MLGGKEAQARQRAERTKWHIEPLWGPIDEAARACNFRTSDMVKRLQRQPGGARYKTLTPGTISHWIDRTGPWRKWKDTVLEKVKAGGSTRDRTGPPLGRPHILVSI